MSEVTRLVPGWVGTLFVSACCLGAGPLLASAAVASGLGFLAYVFNIYVLGPLVLVSVAWTLINSWRWARALRGAPGRSPGFWLTALGGVLVVAGVFLPPLAAARAAGTLAIIAGLVAMIGGAAWALGERRRLRRSAAGA